MNEPPAQQEEHDEQTTPPSEVWAQLDSLTRARVIELFAHAAYKLVIAQRRAVVEEDCDVYSGREEEDYNGAH
jgi:hypothetical protein